MNLPAYDAILAAPFGALGVRLHAMHIRELVFLPPDSAARNLPPHRDAQTAELLDRLAAELAAYYQNPQHDFHLPLYWQGTPFRQAVWQALCGIPSGQTVTYGELARQLSTAPRAVGQAVGDNPLPILIPCHRVVAADGGLGGFMHSRVGFSQDIKRWLLAHEHAC